MMIIGIGVDLCPVERMEQILQRHGEIFADRVFTQREKDYAGQGANKAERLAARFAAKEAVIKALGGSPKGLRWQDMEVVNETSGRPTLKLHGAAAEEAKKMGATKHWLSLTHAGKNAVAMVVMEGEQNHVG